MNNTNPLQRWVQVLFLLFMVFTGLYFTKPFLVPLTFAVILAMLFYPFCKWFEAKNVNRGFASLLSVLTFVVIITGIISLLIWQLTNMASEMSGMEEKLRQMMEKAELSVQQTFGVSKEKQEQFLQKQRQSGGGGLTTKISAFFSYLSSFLVDSLLTLVYFFLLLFFRKHLRQFILKVVPVVHHDAADKIIFDSSKVARKYITGLGIMIVMLWVMYGIGFSIVGVKNAIFFAILCGILEIVPFIGNLTGTFLTIIGSITQDGGNMVIGILVVYALVQFIQTYLIEPLVVGSEQNINPLFTIIILIVGELIWGIPGMVLALPLLGITKVICDNVEPLKPYGFLIGKEKKDDNENIGKKIKKLFS